MGRLAARDFKEQSDQGLCSERAMLTWHLRSNHFPPHPHCMIDVAEEALSIAREAGCYADDGYEWIWFDESMLDQEIDLPDGVLYKDGSTNAPVRSILESLHLWELI